MPRDAYIRDKFTRKLTTARKVAREYFERYPKDRYETEVESWRQIQSQNIEFTMKRFARARGPWSLPLIAPTIPRRAPENGRTLWMRWSQRKMAPFEGAIHPAASFGSLALGMMMMMMWMMMMGGTHRLCAWNREGNSGDGGQSESKFSHEHYSWPGFLSVQKMAKASARVKQIFMNGRSGRGNSRSAARARITNCCGAVAPLPGSLRTRQDRARPVKSRLETSGPLLSRRQVAELGEGEVPSIISNDDDQNVYRRWRFRPPRSAA
jgi:hypothetical protein